MGAPIATVRLRLRGLDLLRTRGDDAVRADMVTRFVDVAEAQEARMRDIVRGRFPGMTDGQRAAYEARFAQDDVRLRSMRATFEVAVEADGAVAVRYAIPTDGIDLSRRTADGLAVWLHDYIWTCIHHPATCAPLEDNLEATLRGGRGAPGRRALNDEFHHALSLALGMGGHDEDRECEITEGAAQAAP